MSDQNQRFPVPPVLKEGTTNVPALQEFVAEFNKLVRWIREVRNISPVMQRNFDPILARLTYVMGVTCDPESSGSGSKDAVVQYWDGSEFVDTTKPVTKSNFEEFFGLPFDADDKVAAIYNRQSGKYIPINMRTVRHARTVRDENNSYPSEASTANGLPVVYPFKFTKIEFTETAGSTNPTIEELCEDVSTQDGYFLNLYCNEFDAYLVEGTDLWIYNVTGQWFTCAEGSECNESSQSSSSQSSPSSASDTSVSSVSSLSSGSSPSSASSESSGSSESSASSQSSQSSESSLSASSASSLSSDLSSASSSVSSVSELSSASSSVSDLSSGSSGGSSESSDLSSGSSGGSSASSDESSGGSSTSSCPPCSGTELTVLTGITTNFDDTTCELTITTQDATICFPSDSGVTVCE